VAGASIALLTSFARDARADRVSTAQIEEIRGVSISSTIMRTMQERNWIRVVGHREVPGRPELLGTTREFLDYFGLKSLDQLPTLADLRDVENIGVQLELPGGEATEQSAENADAPAAEDVQPDGEVVASDDSSEVSTEAEESAELEEGEDAEEAEDDETDDEGNEGSGASTLVASEDDIDERRAMREPPTDQN
jgi:segregation and condensation protein B